MAVHEITHPLVRHKLGHLREKNISTKDFRELASEVGMLLTYEATKHLPAEKVTIDCWSGPAEVERIKGKNHHCSHPQSWVGDDGWCAQGGTQCKGVRSGTVPG